MKEYLAILLLIIPYSLFAQTDKGLELSVEGSHKFTKSLSASIGVELRTCEDFTAMTWDRGSIGVGATYRLGKHLKLSAGYNFLLDQNEEKINLDDDGVPYNWRPSYYGARHRFNAALTGDVDLGRFNVSLRERWQYTYRPEKVCERFDFEDGEWEEKTIGSKAKNQLRSRLQVEYNIRKCPLTPFASIEVYNTDMLEKVRYAAGASWKINKKQSLDFFYRYQNVRDADDDEPSRHTIGASYNIKF